jgi:hypothetical protein
MCGVKQAHHDFQGDIAIIISRPADDRETNVQDLSLKKSK